MSSANLKPATKKIWIFRHGETDWNKEGRMQGHIDIDLNETGRAQALALQKYFAKNPVEVFLSSDLKRAKETAEIARGSLQVPHEIDLRQRETNLGQAEGLTKADIAAKIAPDAFDTWTSHDPTHWDYRFPNG
ncbi:MAG: histidine phosphatase family protein, partial [Proteobacteria bacterium]